MQMELLFSDINKYAIIQFNSILLILVEEMDLSFDCRADRVSLILSRSVKTGVGDC